MGDRLNRARYTAVTTDPGAAADTDYASTDRLPRTADLVAGDPRGLMAGDEAPTILVSFSLSRLRGGNGRFKLFAYQAVEELL